DSMVSQRLLVLGDVAGEQSGEDLWMQCFDAAAQDFGKTCHSFDGNAIKTAFFQESFGTAGRDQSEFDAVLQLRDKFRQTRLVPYAYQNREHFVLPALSMQCQNCVRTGVRLRVNFHYSCRIRYGPYDLSVKSALLENLN